MWAKFRQLHFNREIGINGPAPISWTAIHAWKSVTGSSLEAWELDVVLRLDRAYFKAKHNTVEANSDVVEEG